MQYPSENALTKRLRSTYHGYVQIAEIDATNETAPYVAKTYRWDPSEPVATRPLSLTLWTREGAARETLYYAHDLRKNVVSLFDGKGLRRASYQYDPYGNITSMEGDMAEENPFRFSSEHHDEDLGLVYYNYRHYNPTDGRWTSRDPIAEKGGWNLYGFVGNRIMDRLDQLGLYTLINARDTTGYYEHDGFVFAQYYSDNYEGEIGECPDCGCVFIWIHGYNVNLSEAETSFKKVETSYRQAQGKCDVYGFAWNGDPGELFFPEATAAARSVGRGAFSKFIRDLKKKCPKTRIHIGTHSLGARVALSALQQPNKGVSGIGHVMLTNAAVDNEVLEPGRVFAQAPQVTTSIHVMHSRYDSVLNRYFRIGSFDTELGQDGPEHPKKVPENVHIKDCTSFFGKDHSAIYEQKPEKEGAPWPVGEAWKYITQYVN